MGIDYAILVDVKPATPLLSHGEIAKLLGPGNWRLTKIHRDGSLTYTKREIVTVQAEFPEGGQ